MSEKEKKGLDILFKAMKRKFPFFIDIKILKISEFFIMIDFNVDYFKFLKFYDVPSDDFFKNRSNEGIKNYFNNYLGHSFYLMTLVDDDYKNEFSNEYNDELEKLMNNLYKSIPSEFHMKTEYDNPKSFMIHGYYFDIIGDE